MKKNFAMRKVKSPQYSLEIKMRQGQMLIINQNVTFV